VFILNILKVYRKGMKMNHVTREVLDIFRECDLNEAVEKIVASTPISDFGFDSLDEVEVIIMLEDRFDIVIMDEEAEGFRDKTVGDVVKAVKKRT